MQEYPLPPQLELNVRTHLDVPMLGFNRPSPLPPEVINTTYVPFIQWDNTYAAEQQETVSIAHLRDVTKGQKGGELTYSLTLANNLRKGAKI